MEHRVIPSEECHEPKHITNCTPADAGKVITPSSTTAGASELRFLTSADLAGGISMDDVSGGAATTADAGKVWTPSSASDGALELRALTGADIDGFNADVEALAKGAVNDLVSAIPAITTADATDPAETMALVNELKAAYNALLGALS